MMAVNEYALFLLVGILFVAIDGQILYRGGRRFLTESPGDTGSNASMARMVTVGFHLVCLGVLALLTLVPLGGSASAPIGRIGIFLLLMGVAHALTISVLSHQREDRVFESRAGTRREPGAMEYLVEDETTPRPLDAADPATTVTPVPDQRGAPARVSPALEHRGPYST
jgi:hypothetical protein